MYYLGKARQALQVECLQRRMLGRSRLFTHPGDLKVDLFPQYFRIRSEGGERKGMVARCECRGGRLRLA